METSESDFCDGRFTLIRRLNLQRSVFLALDSETRSEVVLKLEPLDSPHPNLRFEHKLAAKLQGNVGVPRLIWFGTSGQWRVLAREMLGPSLQDLFLYCGRVFSLKTVLMIADQLLSRLELCHSRDYLHRNIVPRHFLIGVGTSAHSLHLIGLERCKRFRHRVTRTHIEYREGRHLVADPKFASINMLAGAEDSRRDDLEAAGYVLLFFLSGKLPWDTNMSPDPRESLASLKSVKINTSLEELCRHAPSEFLVYLNYCRSLKFEQKPDYGYLKRLFRDRLQREHYSNDFIFDWNVYHYNKHKTKHDPHPSS